MFEHLKKIVFVEGPQGCGKTTAVNHLADLGFRSYRGIPTGPELARNREVQNWKMCSRIYEVCLAETNGCSVSVDRSIWSLVAYNIGRKPQHRDLIYRIGRDMFKRRQVGICEPLLIFLDAEPSTCFSREERDTVHSHKSQQAVCKEIEIYDWLANKLLQDGFRVERIINEAISKEEFLRQVAKAASN